MRAEFESRNEGVVSTPQPQSKEKKKEEKPSRHKKQKDRQLLN
jgi:hypothetical protein